jgi:hypothetical protein
MSASSGAMSTATMVYLAVAPCGCPHGIETETGSAAAAQVAKWIRRGSVVERVPLDEAKQRMVMDCPHTPQWGR